MRGRGRKEEDSESQDVLPTYTFPDVASAAEAIRRSLALGEVRQFPEPVTYEVVPSVETKVTPQNKTADSLLKVSASVMGISLSSSEPQAGQ